MLSAQPGTCGEPGMLGDMSASSDPARNTPPVHAPSPGAADSPGYVERLVPGPWTWVAVGVFALFTFITIVVMSLIAAAIVASVTLIVGCVAVWVLAPVIRVQEGELWAGRAHIPVVHLGPASVLDRAGVQGAMGPSYDPRSFSCLRVGTGHAVTFRVLDPQDPTPSWLVSTRRPEDLVRAVDAARKP